ncbi:FAD-binding domain-containing protein [Motiliproteus sp. SC1-56]|uniref:FAD-binding domain-containing protein n=1 Tax=Motiliproteus sp. SC1-56 TaxID=2799565 RepID=UPI001A909FAB|nr:FAD-binding domain-containing protein [Motiliproteus sp. SC1-56]
MHNRALLWFNQDLRLDDNLALRIAARQSRQLLCIYCLDPVQFRSDHYGTRGLGERRWGFLHASLAALDQALDAYGQRLHVLLGEPVQLISQLVPLLDLDAVYRGHPTVPDEFQPWQRLQQRFPYLRWVAVRNGELFSQRRLPFPLSALPTAESDFIAGMVQGSVPPPCPPPRVLPPPPPDVPSGPKPPPTSAVPSPVPTGERELKLQLQCYLQTPPADGEVSDPPSNCRLDPWFANGSLSPRRAWAASNKPDVAPAAQKALRAVLLRREYYRWHARYAGDRLYAFSGVAGRRPLTSFYPERFARWCQGDTPLPLVNACLNELNSTGLLAPWGRRLAARYLVKELAVDWRAGARYFQQQRLDYDAAENWGLWQQVAGVGPAAGQEQCDLEDAATLSARHDPTGAYQRRWSPGTAAEAIDSVDPADWPIPPRH